MINKIQVKNVATYDENGITIENISKINYIYGANGCGKTTISNFLSDQNAGKFSECKLEWENNISEKTFVYNKEFRDRNFRESDIAGIFTLGQATSDVIEEIKQKKMDLANIKNNILASNKTIEGLQEKIEEENTAFKEILWKDVYKVNEINFKTALVGYLKRDSFATKLEGTSISQTANHDRNEVESRAKEILGEQPVRKNRMAKINADQLLEIEKLNIWNKCIVGKADIPIAKLIGQFGNSDWVNQGRKYITVGAQCPFCQKETMDDAFKAQLESFFDKEFEDDVKELTTNKQDYEREKTRLLNRIEVLLSENSQELEGISIDQIRDALEKCLIANEKSMEEKIKEPGKKVSVLRTDKYINDINILIDNKNIEIDKHNSLVDNYQDEKTKLMADVWALLAEENSAIVSGHKKKIEGLNKGIQATTTKKQQYENEKRNLELEIREKNKQVTSVQPAVDEINRILQNYGFSNFSISPSPENENHYQIKRPDGTLAESTLSEGEVTFITFLYFLQWIKGSHNEEDVTQDRVVVIDDPISSLDSNILFVVSSLLKDVIFQVMDGSSDIKQVFILTHNVYFHKELSFIGNGNNSNKLVHYWILRKKNQITNVQYYGIENPISSSYELLWKELKEIDENSSITIQNVMRRIIENYFKILGKYKDDELINKFPNYESQEICRSLLSWINDGSHCMPDDLYVESVDDSLERYQEVFKKIFEYTNHIEHYNMMMGIKEEAMQG